MNKASRRGGRKRKKKTSERSTDHAGFRALGDTGRTLGLWEECEHGFRLLGEAAEEVGGLKALAESDRGL